VSRCPLFASDAYTSARDRLSMLMMRTAISIALALWMLLLALWQVHAQFFRPPASVYEHMRAKQMKILATAAVLALTSVSATGAERYQPNEALLHTMLPPAEYDKPFVGNLKEFIINDLEKLASFCGGQKVLGCAHPIPLPENALCTIYLASDDLIRKRGLPNQTIETVRRHEIAHCNGWYHPPVPDLPKIDPWSLKVSK
jgi:hypothetical protein